MKKNIFKSFSFIVLPLLFLAVGCTDENDPTSPGTSIAHDVDANNDSISTAALEGADFVLQLLHFADVDGDEATALDTVGRFSALVDTFKNHSIYGPNTLFVSSGDHIIPGPRYNASEQSAVKNITGSDEPGSADIAMMNAMGVDAAAIGNHELDSGPGEFGDSINKDNLKACFPHLAANITFSGESSELAIGTDGDEAIEMKGKVAKYAVVTVHGEKIGVVGASGPTFPNITSMGALTMTHTGGTSATGAQIAAAIQPSVNALVAKKVDKIVVIAHMQQISVEKAMAAALKDVDIIVAGGSSTRMGNSDDTLYTGDSGFDETYPYESTDANGKPILVVNVDGDYKYLGRLVVGFDENGEIITDSISDSLTGACASTSEVVSSIGGKENSTVAAIQDAINGFIDESYSTVVGYTSVYLDGRREIVRTEESNLGNLLSDAYLWYAKLMAAGTSVGSVDICLHNGGGIRAAIGEAIVDAGTGLTTFKPPQAIASLGIAEGAVSKGHMTASLRFNNGLVVVKVTGTELKGLLEHGVSASGSGKTPGQFPQVGGFRYKYNLGNSDNNKITEIVLINDSGNDTTTIYTGGAFASGQNTATFNMVTINFLANDGDGYEFTDLSDANRHNLYSGKGFGEETDFPDLDLTDDPGAFSFSDTGGQQDAFAEYMANFHGSTGSAFDVAETDAASDTRIVKERSP